MNFINSGIKIVTLIFLCSVVPVVAAQKDPGGTKDIFEAVRKGLVGSVNYWLDNGANIEARNQYGFTPLMLAVDLNKLEAMRTLLDRGANIEATDNRGFTALTIAAVRAELDMVRELLDRKANVEVVNQRGFTILMEAVDADHVDVAEMLLERGANIMAINKEGQTAFTIALKARQLDMIELLLQHGAKLVPYNIVERQDIPIILFLMQKGFHIDLNGVYTQGETFLIQSVMKSDYRVIDFLIEQGADPYIKDAAGLDAFDYAWAVGDKKVIDALQKTKHGSSLHEAMRDEAVEVFNSAKLMTQTELHFNQFRDQIVASYGEVMQDALVQKCIAKERAVIQEGNCVFYRAEAGAFRIYQYFLKELYRLFRQASDKGSFIFTRFFKDGAQQQTIDEYMKSNQDSDYRARSKDLLSLNIPLFGNVTRRGSCTWNYFVKNQPAENIILEPFFKAIFDRYGFSQKYLKRLLHLNQSASAGLSSLQQIIIPKNIVDNVVMLSSGFYVPLDEEHSMSAFLDQYNQGSLVIDDSYEAMMLINALYGLNPESGIQFNLYSRLPEKKLTSLKDSVKKITDEMFSEWLAGYIACEHVPQGVENEEFCHAVKTFGKGDVDRQEAYFRAVKERGQEEIKEDEASLALTIEDKKKATAQQAGRLARERQKKPAYLGLVEQARERKEQHEKERAEVHRQRLGKAKLLEGR
ncbi:MAG TPA: ankyrin repeat domain-containing protein [Candidatus Babeliales bacterium]|nr:ankyrin repeat domain-containing protein [Candidatus Babeliales bacterium]